MKKRVEKERYCIQRKKKHPDFFESGQVCFVLFFKRKLSEGKDEICKENEQKVNAGIVDAVYKIGKKGR